MATRDVLVRASVLMVLKGEMGHVEDSRSTVPYPWDKAGRLSPTEKKGYCEAKLPAKVASKLRHKSGLKSRRKSVLQSLQ